MKITRDEVCHVARLARLNIDEQDLDRFAEQLGSILSYVDSLGEVDASDIAPTAHAVDIKNALREDEPRDSLDQQTALSNAPESEDGCFVVPKIIE